MLLGLMGAGKTTVGRALGRRLRWRLSDSDEEIRASTGRTVRELGADIGVERMHELEHQHLLTALRANGESVVCAAASVVDDPTCCSALAGPGIVTVFLDASPAVLANRFASNAHRPAYGDDPEKFLTDQLIARWPKFRALSQIVVEVGHLTVDEAVDVILSALSSKPGPTASR